MRKNKNIAKFLRERRQFLALCKEEEASVLFGKKEDGRLCARLFLVAAAFGYDRVAVQCIASGARTQESFLQCVRQMTEEADALEYLLREFVANVPDARRKNRLMRACGGKYQRLAARSAAFLRSLYALRKK